MKYFILALTSLFSALHAEEGWNQQALSVDQNRIHAIASFEKVDFFTTFSPTGEFLWEVPFSAKIDSWKKGEDGLFFILSKSRDNRAYYVSCIDSSTGKLAWEKTIFSPPN